MSEEKDKGAEAYRQQLAALEQFISGSFFGKRDTREVFGSGKFIRGEITLDVAKLNDDGTFWYLITMKNSEDEELGFGLHKDRRVLACDDGKDYPVSDEQIAIIKSVAKS